MKRLKTTTVFLLLTTCLFYNSFAQNNELKKNEKEIDHCECVQSYEKLSGRYIPPIGIIASYEAFCDITKWKFPFGKKEYENLYIKNLQANVGDESFYQFSAISYSPIKLVHPDGTFILNLTPCKIENNFYELPVSLSYNHSIKKYMNDFDYKTFDHYAKSYFEILLNIVGINPEEILKEILLEKTKQDSDEKLTELNQYILNLNKRYKTVIKPILPEGTDIEEKINNINTELGIKNVDFTELVLNDFVLINKTKHKITEKEKEKLENIFRNRYGNFKIENIVNIIYPQCRASFTSIKKIGIEINRNILRSWDVLKNHQTIDTNGQDKSSIILAELSTFDYSSYEGLNTEITNICMPPSEISGTGILIDFNKAILIATKDQQNKYNLNSKNYPLFIKDPILIKSQPIKEGRNLNIYDTLLSNYTGLLIPTTELIIPFHNKTIKATGLDIILNNKLISGTIKIQISNEETNDQNSFKILIDNSYVVITNEEFEGFLNSIGLKHTKIVKEKGFLKFYFKKTI